MTDKQAGICARLMRLGFAQQCQMRLYGQEFELLSDPIVMADGLIFVDAIEKKSRQPRRVRIPLTMVNRAGGPALFQS